MLKLQDCTHALLCEALLSNCRMFCNQTRTEYKERGKKDIRIRRRTEGSLRTTAGTHTVHIVVKG